MQGSRIKKEKHLAPYVAGWVYQVSRMEGDKRGTHCAMLIRGNPLCDAMIILTKTYQKEHRLV